MTVVSTSVSPLDRTVPAGGRIRRTGRVLALLGAAATAAALATPMGSAHAATSISGTFQLVHGDSAHGDVDRAFVRSATGLYALTGAHRYSYRTGQAITVAGRVTGHDIAVSTVSAASGTTAAATASTTSPAAMKVLVELVTWTTPDSMTQASAQQLYGSTDSSWFANESYGTTTMTATATNWLTIATPTDPDGTYTSCDNIGAIESAGDAAAAAAGYSVADYTNVVYYYPTCPGERWGGWGEQPGDRTFLIGELDERVSVHELGHNLGLGHSHSDTCTDTTGTVAYSATCSVNEYGDPTSAMAGGFSGQGMYTASQQAYLGWLGTPAHAVAAVSTAGTYTLAPLESAAGGTQALRVTDSSGRQFWVEYRQPSGNDAFLTGGETNGVLIRTGDDTTELYDMTPATAGTFTDAVLAPGKSWSTPLSNVRVTVKSVTAAGASVTVAYPATAAPASGLVEETAAAVVSTGTWASTPCVTASCSTNRTENLSTTVGSATTLRFTGTSVAWIASTGPTAGKARVYVDGTLKATVNLAAATARDGVTAYASSALPAGAHTLRVQVTTAKPVTVDAFAVTA